jgi:DMSO reductase anchor subunit
MHPAASVILFTTSSGAGYGLLALIGILWSAHQLPASRWFGLAALVIALGLIVLGLLSSTLHLKRPARGVYAFSQWRSSWLSREGVAAVVTFAPAAVFAFGWVILDVTGGSWVIAALLAALGAAATVYSTGMIYASLKPIRQWHHPLVVPVYLAFALATGAVWLLAITSVFAGVGTLLAVIALAALAFAWMLKLAYWRSLAGSHSASTPETATGLKGPVRPLMWPHTGENYLLHELGYRVARKHAAKLRRISVLFGALVPAALIVVAWAVPAAGIPAAILAAVFVALGVAIERWLFFAEAQHTVTLYYYGAEAA